MTDDPSAFGSAFFAPEDFVPDDRCKGFAAEHGINLELELAAFLANGFSRPKKWQQAFFHWLCSRRVWNEGARARERVREANRVPRAPVSTWEPNAKHRAFCEQHGLDVGKLAAKYLRSGKADAMCKSDTDRDFGVRLTKVAKGLEDGVLGRRET